MNATPVPRRRLPGWRWGWPFSAAPHFWFGPGSAAFTFSSLAAIGNQSRSSVRSAWRLAWYCFLGAYGITEPLADPSSQRPTAVIRCCWRTTSFSMSICVRNRGAACGTAGIGSVDATRSAECCESVVGELPELESDRALYDLARQTIREQPEMFVYTSVVRLGSLWSPLAHQLNATESTRAAVRAGWRPPGMPACICSHCASSRAAGCEVGEAAVGLGAIGVGGVLDDPCGLLDKHPDACAADAGCVLGGGRFLCVAVASVRIVSHSHAVA